MNMKTQKRAQFYFPHPSKPDKPGYDRAMSGLSITFCAPLSFAEYIDRRRYASLGKETTLGGTAYVSNKIFNASNFLMAASQANHPLLR